MGVVTFIELPFAVRLLLNNTLPWLPLVIDNAPAEVIPPPLDIVIVPETLLLVSDTPPLELTILPKDKLPEATVTETEEPDSEPKTPGLIL